MNRRDFLKIGIGGSAAAIGTLALGDGAVTLVTMRERAAKLHPREDKLERLFNDLGNHLDSAIENLGYRAAYTTLICSGKPVHCTPIYHPERNPKPNNAITSLNNALSVYNKIPQNQPEFSRYDITPTPKVIDDVVRSLPKEDQVQGDHFGEQAGKLGSIRGPVKSLEDEYEKILYKEQKGNIAKSVLELSAGPALAIYGIYRFVKWREERMGY